MDAKFDTMNQAMQLVAEKADEGMKELRKDTEKDKKEVRNLGSSWNT